MAPAPVTALIFDLGNVVFDYSYDRMFAWWGRRYDRDPQELRRRFSFDFSFEQLERGEIANEDYIAHVGELLGIDFTFEDFSNGWGDIYMDLRPAVVGLIARYRRNVRVVALTNTNALHYPFWQAKYGPVLEGAFERIFRSFEIHARKPEPRAFQIVLDYLNLPPDKTLFLDDNPAMVAGAERLRIRSSLVSSSREIEEAVQAAFTA